MQDPILKVTKSRKTGDLAQVVEYLCSWCKTLNLTSHTTTTTTKKKKNSKSPGRGV
jgi:phage FluMu protein Com